MKVREFIKKDKKELVKMLEEERGKLRQLRFNLASGKVKNISEMRKIKKDIARISTLINKE